ncbi:MAG TPA: PASTA domain-containing protein [Gaiellaceae bacterium]|nr:PASTA domain-containing protein [Gaiellaceae bacterium]
MAGGGVSVRTLLVVGTVACLLPLLSASEAAGPGTTRVSVAAGGAQANGHSLVPATSADGRFVAFYSEASNLVSEDTNGVRDVFVHDRGTGTTTRESVDGSGGQANGQSFSPTMSADGRFVAFYSHASNLVAGDTNGADDVFVRDRTSRTTARVSVATGGTQANGGSYVPALSADGRFVAFLSDASNLVAGDTNRVRDVFVHDRATGTTTRVDLAPDGQEANVGSTGVAISGDGRFVAFASFASNLVVLDENEGSDIFVHDRAAATTERVNVYDPVTEAEGDSFRPAISADGRFVAFDSDAWNLVWGDLNIVADVFVHDRETGATTRVSVDDRGAEGNGPSLAPTLSTDGRFVAFSSDASNVVAADTNGSTDVFVHDRQSGATTRISVDSARVEANGDSSRAALSGDGRFVAFDSAATNLVQGDTNQLNDVFVREPAAEPPPHPPPPPPARPVRCVVPRVIGLRLAQARARIVAANCRVGRVRRARSRLVGRVLAQSPRAGLRFSRGTRVNLVVGRRKLR